MGEMASHLQRDDLRILSYLRPRGLVPFWALVAPDTGDTVLYNKARKRAYSFYRPNDPERQISAIEGFWIELVWRDIEWWVEYQWQWQN